VTLHSVHVDRIDAVTATIHALEQPQPIRREAADELRQRRLPSALPMTTR
jgi:hypothetical protein